MKGLWPNEGITIKYEKLVLSFVQVLLMTLILVTVLELGYLFWRTLTTTVWSTVRLDDLQNGLLKGFAGALLIMIGLELLETTRANLQHHHIRLEVIMVVAVVAAARHIVLLDVAHLDGLTLMGIAVLILSMAAAFYAVRKWSPSGAAPADTSVPSSAEDTTPKA